MYFYLIIDRKIKKNKSILTINIIYNFNNLYKKNLKNYLFKKNK